jgi:hypothetical protein
MAVSRRVESILSTTLTTTSTEPACEHRLDGLALSQGMHQMGEHQMIAAGRELDWKARAPTPTMASEAAKKTI